jgi:hypothetical protein
MEIRIVEWLEQRPPGLRFAAARVGSHRIYTMNLIPRVKEAFAKSATDKAGPAGDQDFLHDTFE